MNTAHATTALQSLIALAGFLFVWNVLWPRHVVDATRQRLFDLRHRLFLVAMRQEGGLTFTSSAYLEKRRAINALINSIGAFNVWTLAGMVAVDLFTGRLSVLRKSDLTLPVETPEACLALAPTEKAVKIEIAKYLYFRSPLFSTLFFACFLAYTAIGAIGRFARRRWNERKPADLDPAYAFRARMQRSVSIELKAVVQMVSEFDKTAPWTQDAEVGERELACSPR